MNLDNRSKPGGRLFDSAKIGSAAMIFVSVLTVVATFLLTNAAALELSTKTTIFAAVMVVYLAFCGGFYYLQNRRANLDSGETGERDAPETQEESFTAEIVEKLAVLEQANAFFSSSLKTSDVFRLVSNRIAEMIPFSACALFLADESGAKLKLSHAAGENAADFLLVEINYGEGLPGGVLLNRRAKLEEKLSRENVFFKPGALKKLKTAVAAPLAADRNSDAFGVLSVYSADEKAFDSKTVKLLEAVAARVSPLFLSSLAFERNLENALTDSLTNLPNERAFFLVLENQIAESQRFRERPLTVLSIDIKNFDELNKTHGYSAADRVLTQAAKIIKSQLRQMDFLARAAGDEFLAILPTASEEITQVIIERVEKAFESNSFDFGGKEKIFVSLHLGAASFIKDGETAEHLLQRAVLKKQESKTGSQSTVLWFPQEYVN